VHTEKCPTEPKRKMYTRGDPKQKTIRSSNSSKTTPKYYLNYFNKE
jgi:hypothetical protein